uniref:G domain-containing protein n=1 Tax=Chromera velia CCMP2878 TaxID=1169474 RepID=A0A0G4IE41_9ALVE|eukprot:Cvel_13604.t1-p1 / transcript=Cvel_13604.t1 / gene=Cvel_13604 / organism=Chromera_velia_CCMP2878 / gene_product=Uncharacterized protein YqeH, putative / transcript_product=Uncharacterized protein YqeH, putative / location=Cvel_scaffold936:44951-56785(+) / protein_length=3433 / sequence_SO=supercontig / SO=protein_coding / is_pseudo=false
MIPSLFFVVSSVVGVLFGEISSVSSHKSRPTSALSASGTSAFLSPLVTSNPSPVLRRRQQNLQHAGVSTLSAKRGGKKSSKKGGRGQSTGGQRIGVSDDGKRQRKRSGEKESKKLSKFSKQLDQMLRMTDALGAMVGEDFSEEDASLDLSGLTDEEKEMVEDPEWEELRKEMTAGEAELLMKDFLRSSGKSGLLAKGPETKAKAREAEMFRQLEEESEEEGGGDEGDSEFGFDSTVSEEELKRMVEKSATSLGRAFHSRMPGLNLTADSSAAAGEDGDLDLLEIAKNIGSFGDDDEDGEGVEGEGGMGVDPGEEEDARLYSEALRRGERPLTMFEEYLGPDLKGNSEEEEEDEDEEEVEEDDSPDDPVSTLSVLHFLGSMQEAAAAKKRQAETDTGMQTAARLESLERDTPLPEIAETPSDTSPSPLESQVSDKELVDVSPQQRGEEEGKVEVDEEKEEDEVVSMEQMRAVFGALASSPSSVPSLSDTADDNFSDSDDDSASPPQEQEDADAQPETPPHPKEATSASPSVGEDEEDDLPAEIRELRRQVEADPSTLAVTLGHPSGRLPSPSALLEEDEEEEGALVGGDTETVAEGREGEMDKDAMLRIVSQAVKQSVWSREADGKGGMPGGPFDDDEEVPEGVPEALASFRIPEISESEWIQRVKGMSPDARLEMGRNIQKLRLEGRDPHPFDRLRSPTVRFHMKNRETERLRVGLEKGTLPTNTTRLQVEDLVQEMWGDDLEVEISEDSWPRLVVSRQLLDSVSDGESRGGVSEKLVISLEEGIILAGPLEEGRGGEEPLRTVEDVMRELDVDGLNSPVPRQLGQVEGIRDSERRRDAKRRAVQVVEDSIRRTAETQDPEKRKWRAWDPRTRGMPNCEDISMLASLWGRDWRLVRASTPLNFLMGLHKYAPTLFKEMIVEGDDEMAGFAWPSDPQGFAGEVSGLRGRLESGEAPFPSPSEETLSELEGNPLEALKKYLVPPRKTQKQTDSVSDAQEEVVVQKEEEKGMGEGMKESEEAISNVAGKEESVSDTVQPQEAAQGKVGQIGVDEFEEEEDDEEDSPPPQLAVSSRPPANAAAAPVELLKGAVESVEQPEGVTAADVAARYISRHEDHVAKRKERKPSTEALTQKAQKEDPEGQRDLRLAEGAFFSPLMGLFLVPPGARSLKTARDVRGLLGYSSKRRSSRQTAELDSIRESSERRRMKSEAVINFASSLVGGDADSDSSSNPSADLERVASDPYLMEQLRRFALDVWEQDLVVFPEASDAQLKFHEKTIHGLSTNSISFEEARRALPFFDILFPQPSESSNDLPAGVQEAMSRSGGGQDQNPDLEESLKRAGGPKTPEDAALVERLMNDGGTGVIQELMEEKAKECGLKSSLHLTPAQIEEVEDRILDAFGIRDERDRALWRETLKGDMKAEGVKRGPANNLWEEEEDRDDWKSKMDRKPSDVSRLKIDDADSVEEETEMSEEQEKSIEDFAKLHMRIAKKASIEKGGKKVDPMDSVVDALSIEEFLPERTSSCLILSSGILIYGPDVGRERFISNADDAIELFAPEFNDSDATEDEIVQRGVALTGDKEQKRRYIYNILDLLAPVEVSDDLTAKVLKIWGKDLRIIRCYEQAALEERVNLVMEEESVRMHRRREEYDEMSEEEAEKVDPADIDSRTWAVTYNTPEEKEAAENAFERLCEQIEAKMIELEDAGWEPDEIDEDEEDENDGERESNSKGDGKAIGSTNGLIPSINVRSYAKGTQEQGGLKDVLVDEQDPWEKMKAKRKRKKERKAKKERTKKDIIRDAEQPSRPKKKQAESIREQARLSLKEAMEEAEAEREAERLQEQLEKKGNKSFMSSFSTPSSLSRSSSSARAGVSSLLLGGQGGEETSAKSIQGDGKPLSGSLSAPSDSWEETEMTGDEEEEEEEGEGEEDGPGAEMQSLEEFQKQQQEQGNEEEEREKDLELLRELAEFDIEEYDMEEEAKWGEALKQAGEEPEDEEVRRKRSEEMFAQLKIEWERELAKQRATASVEPASASADDVVSQASPSSVETPTSVEEVQGEQEAEEEEEIEEVPFDHPEDVDFLSSSSSSSSSLLAEAGSDEELQEALRALHRRVDVEIQRDMEAAEKAMETEGVSERASELSAGSPESVVGLSTEGLERKEEEEEAEEEGEEDDEFSVWDPADLLSRPTADAGDVLQQRREKRALIEKVLNGTEHMTTLEEKAPEFFPWLRNRKNRPGLSTSASQLAPSGNKDDEAAEETKEQVETPEEMKERVEAEEAQAEEEVMELAERRRFGGRRTRDDGSIIQRGWERAGGAKAADPLTELGEIRNWVGSISSQAPREALGWAAPVVEKEMLKDALQERRQKREDEIRARQAAMFGDGEEKEGGDSLETIEESKERMVSEGEVDSVSIQAEERVEETTEKEEKESEIVVSDIPDSPELQSEQGARYDDRVSFSSAGATEDDDESEAGVQPDFGETIEQQQRQEEEEESLREPPETEISPLGGVEEQIAAVPSSVSLSPVKAHETHTAETESEGTDAEEQGEEGEMAAAAATGHRFSSSVLPKAPKTKTAPPALSRFAAGVLRVADLLEEEEAAALGDPSPPFPEKKASPSSPFLQAVERVASLLDEEEEEEATEEETKEVSPPLSFEDLSPKPLDRLAVESTQQKEETEREFEEEEEDEEEDEGEEGKVGRGEEVGGEDLDSIDWDGEDEEEVLAREQKIRKDVQKRERARERTERLQAQLKERRAARALASADSTAPIPPPGKTTQEIWAMSKSSSLEEAKQSGDELISRSRHFADALEDPEEKKEMEERARLEKEEEKYRVRSLEDLAFNPDANLKDGDLRSLVQEDTQRLEKDLKSTKEAQMEERIKKAQGGGSQEDLEKKKPFHLSTEGPADPARRWREGASLSLDKQTARSCPGCGVAFQGNEPDEPGFVPPQKYSLLQAKWEREESQQGDGKGSSDETSGLICARCHSVTTSGQVEEILRPGWSDSDLLSPGRFVQLLSGLRNKRCLVVLVTDLADFDAIPNLSDVVGKNPVLVAANKADLLPSDVSKKRVMQWVHDRLKRDSGLAQLRPRDIFLVSAKTGHNIALLLSVIGEEARLRGRDVYLVGTANAGKSSVLNYLLSGGGKEKDKEGGGLKLLRGGKAVTTSVVPGTTLGLVKVSVKGQKFSVFDTPGILLRGNAAPLLKQEELRRVMPSKSMSPRTVRIERGKSLLLGGLVKVDMVEGEPFFLTLFASDQLPIHMASTDKAFEVLEKRIKAGELTPPFSMDRWRELQGPPSEIRIPEDAQRWERWGRGMSPLDAALPSPTEKAAESSVGSKFERAVLRNSPFGRMAELEQTRLSSSAGRRGSWKEASCDIVIPGIGFLAVTGVGNARFRVWVPDGVEVYTRPPLLPFEARSSTGVFTGGHFVVKGKKTGRSGPTPKTLQKKSMKRKNFT